MRWIMLVALAATAVSAAGAAMAQQAPAPAPRSVDEFICELSGVCGEDERPVATIPAPNTRGFRPVRRSLPRMAPPATVARRTLGGQAGGAPAARPRRRPAPPVRTASARTETPAHGIAGARVDLSLLFELGSAVLTEEARAQATLFARALLAPVLASDRARIEGHTDNSGGRSYNLDLSRRRAEAVAEFLGTLGVARARLEVQGFGYDRPLAGQSAAAPENRRVEAVLISGS